MDGVFVVDALQDLLLGSEHDEGGKARVSLEHRAAGLAAGIAWPVTPDDRGGAPRGGGRRRSERDGRQGCEGRKEAVTAHSRFLPFTVLLS